MKIFYLGISFIVLFFLSLPLLSQDNYEFLDDTAGQYFTDQDWAMFEKAMNKSLNNYKDGEKLQWKNPATGSWGSFMPSHSTRKTGILCRDLTIVNGANNRIGKSTLTFCKINHKWKGI